MTKVFISQPMSGKTAHEIQIEREALIKKAKEEINGEVEIINNMFPQDWLDNRNNIWCLGLSIIFLSEANIAYFAKGWEVYRGCQIENEVCKKYGIDIVYE